MQVTIEEKVFIKKLLSIDGEFEEDTHRISCFSLALKGARYNMGWVDLKGEFRYDLSAVKEGLYKSKMFTGITLYLIILEQMGTILKKSKSSFQNGIKITLESFAVPALSKAEIDAIARLRHSLAHNFGLASKDKQNSNSDLKFCIGFGINDELIKLPNQKWKGDYSDKSDETLTKVGIYGFANLAEGIITYCLEEIENDNVELQLSLDEIKARFTII